MLDSIAATTDDAIFLKDAFGVYRFVNRAAAAVMGRSVEAILGLRDADVFAAEVAQPMVADDEQVRRGVGTQAFDERIGGRVFLATKTPYPFPDSTIGVLGIGHDITERRRADDRLAAIATLSRAISSRATVREIAHAADEPLRVATDADAVWIFVEDPASRRLINVLADGLRNVTADELQAIPPDHPTLAVEGYRTGEPRIVHASDETEGSPYRLALDSEGLETALVIPLSVGGSARGSLNLAWRRDRRDLGAPDLEFFANLAIALAEGMSRAQATAGVRAALGTFQRALLPNDAFPSDLQVAVRYEPAADALRLGGDWYDVFELPDGLIGIATGDVVGHGVGAAAVMGQLRSALRALAQVETDPGALLDLLDLHARNEPGAAATTVAFVTLDRTTGIIRYSCAGHLPPLLVDADGASRYLDGGRGLPIGLSQPTRPRATDTAMLGADGLLVLYTDGLVERRTTTIDHGMAQLRRAAEAHRDLGVEAFADSIVADLEIGAGLDDTALICVRGPNTAWFNSRIRADARELRVIRRALHRWLESGGFTPARRDDIVVATMEAVSNAIEHGYGLDGEGTVVVEAALDHELEVSIRDSGQWLDPIRRPERGRGQTLMEALSDRVDRQSSEAGTIVTLWFATDPDPAARSRVERRSEETAPPGPGAGWVT